MSVFKGGFKLTGSLQIKSGTYYAVLNFKDNRGNRKQKWVNTQLSTKGNNKRKAENVLKKLIQEYEEKRVSPFDDVPFVDYILQWLDIIKTQVDEVTYQGYELTAKRHVIPYFEPLKLKLNDVSPQKLQEYYNYKYKHGRLNGKGGLSAKSIKQHHVVISHVFKEALRKNIINYNPADRVTLPKPERYEGKFYPVDQIKILFSYLKNEDLLPLIMITVLYGLRRSELLGLKWDSIDFDKETVTICHTVSKCTKVVEKNKTKNNSSKRTYPMMMEIKQILQQARTNEKLNKLKYGDKYIQNDYVFKWPDGHPYSPDYISRRFHNLLLKYNLPLIRFHDLRHSCASMLLEMGYDLKDIQEWLGHSDIKMTANIYGHLTLGHKKKLGESFSKSLAI